MGAPPARHGLRTATALVVDLDARPGVEVVAAAPLATRLEVVADPAGRHARADDGSQDALTLAEVVRLVGWLGVPSHPRQD